jgi:hypothetical protein
VELEALKARLKILEDQNQNTVVSLLSKINGLALKAPQDFDKYQVLAFAQELVRVATTTNHEKATYFSVGLQEIQARLDKPPAQFKAYFLTLFADSG